MAGTASPATRQVVSIQYLRGVAALGVVIFHSLEATHTRFPTGAAGVDVFFVISGFIMWTVTERVESRASTFLWRRIIRIVPPYWVATLATAVILVVRPHFLLPRSHSLNDLVRSLFFIPYGGVWGSAGPVLLQGWTLNYEMFFYFVFASALLLPRRRQLTTLTCLLAPLAVAGLVLDLPGAAAQTYLSPLLFEFLAGAYLGRLWLRGHFPGGGVGLGLVFGSLIAFGVETWMGVYESPSRWIFWGLPALCLVAGALGVEAEGWLFRSKTMKALGDGSYSIYLFHVPLVALGFRVLGGAPGPLRVVATAVACGMAGMVLHHVLERPVTRALRGLAWKGTLETAPARAADYQTTEL